MLKKNYVTPQFSLKVTFKDDARLPLGILLDLESEVHCLASLLSELALVYAEPTPPSPEIDSEEPSPQSDPKTHQDSKGKGDIKNQAIPSASRKAAKPSPG